MTDDFIVGLRDLRRTQGARRPLSRTAAFTEAVSTGLINLPAGREVMVTGSVESVGDGVLVDARVETVMDAQCSRCLVDFSLPVDVEFQELFVYPEQAQDYADEDVSFIHDDAVDLTETVRDAIIIDQPLIPLCRPDCRGLCPECGADLNADPDHSHGEAIDSRWLGLAQWGKMS